MMQAICCKTLIIVLLLQMSISLACAQESEASENSAGQLSQQQLDELYLRAENALREASANQNYAKAIELYRQASAAGHQRAQERLAWLLNYLPTEPSLADRYRRELARAKEGHLEAQFLVGEMCEYGIGVEADFKRAMFWYRKAARANSGQAQNRLGELYAYGIIGEADSINEQQVLQWIQAAAANGQADAQLKLAKRHLEGRGLKKDSQQAFYWFEQAANNGNAYAQMQAGYMLKQGEGVKQDYEQALYWFEKAEKQGYVGAQKEVKAVNYILDEIFLENFK